MAENKVLIILGMYRSGTSLITQWLNACGLHVGDDLLGPGIGNEDGHFEDWDFINLHRRIFESHNIPDTGMKADWPLKISEYEYEKIKSLIDFKNRLHIQWGWKEPRTCIFLNYYRELLPDAKYIIVFRDYKSVVSSLVQRENKFRKSLLYKKKRWKSHLLKFININQKADSIYKSSSETYLKGWINFNKALLLHIESLNNKNFIITDISSLIKNYDQVCSIMRSQWNFDIELFNFKNIYKEKYISKQRNIDQYIKDEKILNDAKQIEKKIFELSFIPPQS